MQASIFVVLVAIVSFHFRVSNDAPRDGVDGGKCSQCALDPNDLRDRLARVKLQWHKVAKQRGLRAALRTIRRATGKPLASQSQTAGAVEAGRAKKAA